ncbi:MAG: DmsE family decaheme c-type cytochrome [Gammaproteobacteria bacterium]|nr:DmsE family decaheme c-type cytochrome [Gammaproteobacteria bacterium]
MSARLLVTTVALCIGALLPGVVASQSPGDATTLPDYSRKGADTCIACHEDQSTLSVFRSKHGTPRDPASPFGHGQLQCESCHGPGDEHSGRVRRGQERPAVLAFGKQALLTIEKQNAYCVDCHAADVGFASHAGAHDMNSVSCADCHSSHAEHDPVLQTATQAEVCFDCHQQQRTQSMKPYAHPVRQGKMDCGSCHNSHGQTTDLMLVRQTLNDTCFDCHAETRGPYLWEHAPVSEDCSNCHDPHGSNQPGMLSMRAPLLCQGCHSEDGHPSLPQDERGLPSGIPSQFLLGQSCLNCHSEVHGSNHPSGSKLMR